jgi:peptidoglycan/LPS O-acetylase OafA/YrhL
LAHPKALAIVEADTAVSFFTSDGVLDTLRHIGASTNLRLGEPALFMLLSSPRTLFWFIAQVAMTPTIFVLFGRIFWFLATGMFLYGAWRYLRREPRNLSALIMIAVVLYFALTTTLVSGFGITSRYRLPVNVFILVFAAYAVSVLISALRRKRRGENA